MLGCIEVKFLYHTFIVLTNYFICGYVIWMRMEERGTDDHGDDFWSFIWGCY